MPLDVSKAPAAASPLWIIALFIALSEATAGVAAIVTAGPPRLIFTCFAVAFPIGVFIVFVWLLIRYPQNLYAPGQYSKEITPEAYRVAMRRDERSVLARAVAETFVEESIDGSARNAEVEKVARRFELAVAESSVTISPVGLTSDLEPLQIPVTDSTTVDSLLDYIFFSFAPALKPYSYNRTWTLVADNGTRLSEMGATWARHQGQRRDDRPISKVGILPGGRLTLVPISANGSESSHDDSE